MTKLIFIVIFISTSLLSFGQKEKLKAYIDVKDFYHPETGSYAEIELQFAIQSASLKTIGDSAFQASIAIYFDILSKNSIIKSDAYILNSPLYQIKDSLIEDFYEIKRYSLEPGKYELKVRIKDLNAENTEDVSGSQTFTINDPKGEITISNILPAEYVIKSDEESVFQRSGLHIIPMFSNFFSSRTNTIPVYCELYNTGVNNDSILGLMYRIMNSKNYVEMEEYTTISRFITSPFIPKFKAINIELLTSGSYLLEICVVNKDFEILASTSYAFERDNDMTEILNSENIILNPAFQESIAEDSIIYYLESLIPISKPAEVKNIVSTIKTKNKDKCRKHIQAFWVKTSPSNSYEAWVKYKKQVDFVEKVYGNNFQEGFETDRGRVYLQYGAPSNIVAREASPSEYPYEIWTFNKIGVFSNKRFVFYNPDLVNRAYRLLHSDMIGELKNNSWPQILSKRNTVNGNIDNPNQNNVDHWGGNSNEYFRQY
jgi:GWxTD domain-containing protein